jgi:hypothetical protein
MGCILLARNRDYMYYCLHQPSGALADIHRPIFIDSYSYSMTTFIVVFDHVELLHYKHATTHQTTHLTSKIAWELHSCIYI